MASTKPYAPMVDFFASDIVEAFAERGCPLCRALEQAETSIMESFLREGRKAREARLSFFDAGGFCRRHAWLFHRGELLRNYIELVCALPSPAH